VTTHPLFAELQSSLVLGDLEQLNHSPLVRGKANNLTHDVADEFVVLGQSLTTEECIKHKGVIGDDLDLPLFS
jgi:hypothetical protein